MDDNGTFRFVTLWLYRRRNLYESPAGGELSEWVSFILSLVPPGKGVDEERISQFICAGGGVSCGNLHTLGYRVWRPDQTWAPFEPLLDPEGEATHPVARLQRTVYRVGTGFTDSMAQRERTMPRAVFPQFDALHRVDSIPLTGFRKAVWEELNRRGFNDLDTSVEVGPLWAQAEFPSFNTYLRDRQDVLERMLSLCPHAIEWHPKLGLCPPWAGKPLVPVVTDQDTYRHAAMTHESRSDHYTPVFGMAWARAFNEAVEGGYPKGTRVLTNRLSGWTQHPFTRRVDTVNRELDPDLRMALNLHEWIGRRYHYQHRSREGGIRDEWRDRILHAYRGWRKPLNSLRYFNASTFTGFHTEERYTHTPHRYWPFAMPLSINRDKDLRDPLYMDTNAASAVCYTNEQEQMLLHALPAFGLYLTPDEDGAQIRTEYDRLASIGKPTGRLLLYRTPRELVLNTFKAGRHGLPQTLHRWLTQHHLVEYLPFDESQVRADGWALFTTRAPDAPLPSLSGWIGELDSTATVSARLMQTIQTRSLEAARNQADSEWTHGVAFANQRRERTKSPILPRRPVKPDEMFRQIRGMCREKRAKLDRR